MHSKLFVYPRSTWEFIWTRLNVSVHSRSNWNLEVLVFEERGKPEYLEKNLSEQRREPTTNSIHIWQRRWDLNPGHIGGRRVLSPLRHPCFPGEKFRADDYPDLGSGSDWLKHIILTAQPHLGSDRSSLWKFCSHFSDSFCRGTSGRIAKCQLFAQATGFVV